MALICPITLGIPPVPRRSFITTGTFHTDIFKYTTAINSSYQTVGTLTTLDALGTGTAALCPGNRILRENGRIISPDSYTVSTKVTANGSGGSVTTASFTLQTILIGVYDAISGLNGFIDPNSPKFQVYNGSKSYQLVDGVNPISGLKDNLGSNGLVSVTATTGAPGGGAIAVPLDVSTGKVFKIQLDTTITLGADTTITVTASNVPIAGTMVYVIFNSGPTNATYAKVLAFTTNFADEGNMTLPATTAGSKNYIFSFVSDGTNLYETARNIGVITSTVVGMQAVGT
jgi:hypothetical protein